MSNSLRAAEVKAIGAVVCLLAAPQV